MARVLVTYGWVRSSYAVVRSLGRHGATVFVGDPARLAMAKHSRYCAGAVRLPDFFADPEAYVAAVAEACRAHAIDWLMPGHEDLYWLALYRDRLPSAVRLVHPPVASMALAMDKGAALEQARQAGCPVPATGHAHSLEGLERLARTTAYPAVLKTRAGNSAKGVAVCRDADELMARARQWITQYGLGPDEYPVVQEHLPGRAIGTCHLFREGEPVAASAEVYLRAKGGGVFGTSTLRQTVSAPEAVAAGERVLRALDWHGVAQMDFMADADGTDRLIEINPRLWGSLPLSITAGVDFPRWVEMLALAEGAIPAVQAPAGVTQRWLLGEGLAALHYLRRGRPRAALRALNPVAATAYDDLCRDDPVPFLFELLDYARRFAASGNANPAVPGMLRRR